MEEVKVILRENTVCIPRSEYDALTRAKMGIDTIAASKTKYGFDSDTIRAVLKVFGIEASDNAE